MARRLEELPAIRAAFERGKLSYSQVRALSRVATPELEAQLLELARRSTAAQLERVLRAYRGVLARELPPEELVHGERYPTCEHDDAGGLVIRGRLPAEEGALLMAALEAGRDRLRSEASEDRRAEPAARQPARHDPAAFPAGQAVSWETRRGAEESRAPSPSNPDALLFMADTPWRPGR